MSKKQPTFLHVKLSSLGDILHSIPIIWDIREHYPNSQIDWVVEEAYVDLLHPLQTNGSFRGIDRIIPIALRRWRRNILNPSHWQELFKTIRNIKERRYDFVIDSQGLIKSAIVASLAGRSENIKIAGLANATELSGYEPLARYFYTETVQVSKRTHAVDRSRCLLSSVLNIPSMDRSSPILFFPKQFISFLADESDISLEFNKPYILCFHASAQETKKWKIDNWVAVGKHVLEKGLTPIYPWGNQDEKVISQAIVNKLSKGIVPAAYSIREYFRIISQAALTVGVDTGLTHLSAVLNRPTIEIYCNSPLWKTEGYWSDTIINLGDINQSPSADIVIDAIDRLLIS